MKKMLCVLAISAVFAACGNSPSNTNGSDTTTTVKADTSKTDSSNMMMNDTTHKDSGVHK